MTYAGKPEKVRGLELLQYIRFPLMDAKHLALRARQILPNQILLESLVLEAMAVKSLSQQDRSAFSFRYLLPGSLQPRAKRSVDWSRYAEGCAVKKITGTSGTTIYALCLVEAFVCCGCDGGTIDVFNKETQMIERTLIGHTSLVCTLTSWNGWLISGSADKSIKVWDLTKGECVRTLDGHTWRVSALTVFGSKLISSSWDSTIKIWEISVAAKWNCERTLAGHAFSVYSLVVREGQIFSGSSDNTIRVWDMSSGECERTLSGHDDTVLALVCNERHLFSAAIDGTIRVWILDVWDCIRTLQVNGSESALYITSLAIQGSKLLSGSCGDDFQDQVVLSECKQSLASKSSHASLQEEIKVLDLNTLECEHTLKPSPPGRSIEALLSMDGAVWAAVGVEICIWEA
jgi:WD40 repeat protein